jgi:hypothetical protein
VHTVGGVQNTARYATVFSYANELCFKPKKLFNYFSAAADKGAECMPTSAMLPSSPTLRDVVSVRKKRDEVDLAGPSSIVHGALSPRHEGEVQQLHGDGLARATSITHVAPSPRHARSAQRPLSQAEIVAGPRAASPPPRCPCAPNGPDQPRHVMHGSPQCMQPEFPLGTSIIQPKVLQSLFSSNLNINCESYICSPQFLF